MLSENNIFKNIEDSTYQRETQSKIPTKKPEKHQGPKTSLKSNGLDFKQGTSNQTEYSKIEVNPREKPAQPKENVNKIIENGALLETKSTTKSAYRAPPVIKKISKKSPPPGTLQVRSKSESSFITEKSQTSHDYKNGFNTTKPPKV